MFVIGSVYFYSSGFNRLTWSLVSKFIASDGSMGDGFGCSVSVYQNVVAVGAPNSGAKGSIFTTFADYNSL